jgi:hypothetical protein
MRHGQENIKFKLSRVSVEAVISQILFTLGFLLYTI